MAGDVNRIHPSHDGDLRLTWDSAAVTDVGTVRKVNEDAFLDRPEAGLWAVADGMGGHQSGDVASGLVIRALSGVDTLAEREALLQDLRQRLISANDALIRLAEERTDGGVIGTTVAIFIGFEGQAICLWVGDSRIYLCRNGTLKQLTRDQSQVEELIKLGLLDREEAEQHPASNVITRAIGADPELKVDLVSGALQAGDTYLLCSDGLNKDVSHDQIAALLQQGGSAEAAQSLIACALEHGARDNVTAVVVKVKGQQDAADF